MRKQETEIRILVTGFTLNRGGVETFVMNYIKEIRKRDHHIYFDILGYEDHPAFEDEIRRNGGKIYRVPSPRYWNARKRMNDFFRHYAGQYHILWCNKCDLADISYLKKAKKYGIANRIIHSHSSSNMHSGMRRMLFAILHYINRKSIAKFATDFWACSDYAADWMFPEQLVKNGRVCYIPNAIEINQFIPNPAVRKKYREQLGIEGNTVFIFVGRLSSVKNPEFAIDLFSKIWDKNPKSALLIVGSGELQGCLKEKVDQEPYRANVYFLGLRNDVPKLLQAADCYLMPSLFEGFPVSSIEAQAAGLPVFAASDGITAQAQLTPLFHFLPLSAGPVKWAEEISKSDLSRKDYKNEICKKGFDIDSAAGKLLKCLYRMIDNKELPV